MRSPLLAMLYLAGCAANETALVDDETGYQDPEGYWDEFTYYRVDVFPPMSRTDEAGNALATDADGDVVTNGAGDGIVLLAQTFAMAPQAASDEGVRVLHLDEPVLVQGFVSGTHTAPTAPPAAAGLPGESVPLVATVSFRQPDSAQVRNVTTDESGFYSALVVPGGDYRASFVSGLPDVPFHSEEIVFSTDTTMDLDLGQGVALWGTVTNPTDLPLSGVRVYAESVFGVAGASAKTGEDGRFVLRVEPGAYTLVSAGRDNGLDPTIRSDLFYVGPEGMEKDVSYPSLGGSYVSGRLVAWDGRPVANGAVRLTAIQLDGYAPTASLVVEDTPDGIGNFAARVVTGTYLVELFPLIAADFLAGEAQLTPVSLGEMYFDADTDLGVIVLDPLVSVSGILRDPSGTAVAGAQIECTEAGFDGRVFLTQSEAEGSFSLQLPGVPLLCVTTPPSARADLAVTRKEIDPSTDPNPPLVIDTGSLLRGEIVYDVPGDTLPLQYALIEVRDTKGDLLGTALSDSEGRFSLRVATSL